MTAATPPVRRALLGALALVLIGAAVVFAWPRPPLDSGEEVFPPPADEGPSPVIPPVRAEGPVAEGKVRVAVRLEVLAGVLPPRPPRPRCYLVSSPSDAGIAGTWVAGLSALPLSRAAKGQQLVRFDLGGGSVHYRVTRLVPEDRGRITLPRGRASVARGKVVDESGRPLSGTSVWLAGAAVETDEEGRFTTPAMPSDSGLPLVVRRAGFATEFRVLSGRQYHELEEVPIVLRPGRELRVRGAVPLDQGTRVSLLPAGGRDTRWIGFPLFFPVIEPQHRSVDGMVTFGGLPPGVEAQVRILHAGLAPAISPPIRVGAPSSPRIAIATVGGAQRATVSGTVVDSQGQGVADAWITSRAGDAGLTLRHTDWLLPPLAYVADGDVFRSGSSGSFAVARLRDGRDRTVVTVEAEGWVGLEYRLRGSGDVDLPVTLFPAREFAPPRLLLTAGDLPAQVRLVVQDEGGTQGPYLWTTGEPFPLGLGRRSLLRVTVRIGDGDPVGTTVLVVGDATVPVGH